MNTVKAALAAIVSAVKAYPHGTAIVLNLGVLALARFGFNVTPDQLVTIIGIVNVAMAAFVKTNTTTKTLLRGK